MLKAAIRRLLPRTVRARRILAGPLRGRRIVTSWHDYPAALTGRTELPLLQWFNKHVKSGETWLDVGAHYGYTAFALAEAVGQNGRVFAFEPMTETVGCIERGRVLNGFSQITVVPFGLGAVDAVAMQSFPVIRGMADMTHVPASHAWRILLPIAQFDWLWPRVNGGNPRIDGIKIDVQGMELDTLTGMSKALEAWHPRLVVEVHEGVSRARLFEFLQGVGYSIDAAPIEPAVNGGPSTLLDNHSYAFSPLSLRALS